jgi:glutamine synthetase
MALGITDIASLDAFIEEHDLRHFKIGVLDVDGVLRGKYVNLEKLRSAVSKGFGFCDVVLGWDSSDKLYEGAQISGWHTGYRDAHVELDLSTARLLPFEEATLLILGGFTGEHAAVCPRALLDRVCQRAQAMGYRTVAAAEYEFFLFNETPKSAREKGYRNLEHFTPGMFGYSVLRNSVHHELYHELLDGMRGMDCELEALHTETGPGVLEAALRHDDALAMGDKAALFKTFTKVLCQRRGVMATFMAKCSNDYPGQSGHLHVSLVDAGTGENIFHDLADGEGMSRKMRQFLSGQVLLMPQLLSMVCSTVNAYRRLVPGMWAPTHANWGIENRTTAVRAIPAGVSGTRSEYRVAPADANPHIALAAAIASGLWGIEQDIEPIPKVEGNAYENPGSGSVALPGTLADAALALRESTVARELFGDEFVDHFALTREWEDREHRKYVSDWDMQRYFEII